MGTYKFTFKYKQLLSLILSICLVFTSIPTDVLGKSFLAPSGEATALLIKHDLTSAQVPKQQKNDSSITRRDFLLNTRNLAASIAATYLLKSNLLMAKDSKKTPPKKISLKDAVTQKELEIYRFPLVFLLEPETFYDFLTWQKRIALSDKPFELGPGYIYHGWTDFDDAIIKGKVIAGMTPLKGMSHRTEGKDHILRSYLTRVPHMWARWKMDDPNSNSPVIYMIHTKEFNRLLNKEKAILDYLKGETFPDMIDPYPNILDSFSLDIVSEIWVRDNDYERYMNLINLPDSEQNQLSEREKKLRQNLMPLIKEDKIKRIPLLNHKLLKKETDHFERSNYVTECIGQWMAHRGLFEKIPPFKEKNQPLPKDEPLTPLDAILKFMSGLPKDLSQEDIVKRFYKDENYQAMLAWFSLLPYSSALFRDSHKIFDVWTYTLKTPQELEARAKEILKDDELVRLFILNRRYRKEDPDLEVTAFLSDAACKAIKTLIHKDYGVNILVENNIRLYIMEGLSDEQTREAMVSFISALEPEKLVKSPICFEQAKEIDKLTDKQIVINLSKNLVLTMFFDTFTDVYNILIARGYSSEKAGKLLSYWSYYPNSVFRKIGTKHLSEIRKSKDKDSKRKIMAERIADEVIDISGILFVYKISKYVYPLFLSAIAVIISLKVGKTFKTRSLNKLKIGNFKVAIKEKLSKKIANLLTDKKIKKLVNLSEPTLEKVTNTLKSIDLTGNQKRTILRIINQIQSEHKDGKDARQKPTKTDANRKTSQSTDKKQDTEEQTAPNSQIQNREPDILKSK